MSKCFGQESDTPGVKPNQKPNVVTSGDPGNNCGGNGRPQGGGCAPGGAGKYPNFGGNGSCH